jgi:hypothetical protein
MKRREDVANVSFASAAVIAHVAGRRRNVKRR